MSILSRLTNTSFAPERLYPGNSLLQHDGSFPQLGLGKVQLDTPTCDSFPMSGIKYCSRRSIDLASSLPSQADLKAFKNVSLNCRQTYYNIIMEKQNVDYILAEYCKVQKIYFTGVHKLNCSPTPMQSRTCHPSHTHQEPANCC